MAIEQKNRLSFYKEIQKNKVSSGLLIGVIAVILVLLVYVIGMAFSGLDAFTLLSIGSVIAIVYVLIGYYYSDKMALASVNAKPAPESQYRQYYDVVEGLSLASGLPMPKLYVMNDPQINAFASGRNPKTAVVCVTTGSLEKLNKQELEGVLAHEMSHVANYDIRFMTLASVLIGMIAIISQIFLRSLWFRSSREDDKGSAIFLIIGIVLAVLAPIMVQLVGLAISRRREFTADANAVKFTRSPTGLINALTKIKSNSDMKVSGAVAPLFIAKPNRVANLFSTHPPLEVRIEKLRRM